MEKVKLGLPPLGLVEVVFGVWVGSVGVEMGGVR